MALILEHFLKFLLNVSYGLRKNNVSKRHPPNSCTLENAVLRSRSVLNCAPRQRVLKLKVRSRAPGFAYINALPAPYKGTQPQRRVPPESHEPNQLEHPHTSCQE